MPWLRLKLQTDAAHVEPLTDLLEKFGADSVSYAPVSDEALYDEPSQVAHLWERTSVIALLDHETDMDILMSCLRNRIGADSIQAHEIELVQECDWVEKYKQGFGAMVFADTLCVCPGWLEPPDGYRHIITLDPGLAFGTGKHPTTSLCLEWLVRNELTARTVIDYGCGSGVLALAAARLNAEKVYALDIDPQAIAATHANAMRNQLEGKIIIAAVADMAPPTVDVLIANILLGPLLEHALKFSTLVRPGGDIVLSGILAGQADECSAAYGRWFRMTAPAFHDEWAILHGVRLANTG